MTSDLKVELIGYDSGWGSKDFSCENGPEKAEIDKILHKLRHLEIEGKFRGSLGIQFLGKHEKITTKEDALPLLIEGLKRLYNHIRHAIDQKYTPVIIGGDHASALGTWPAVASTLDKNKKLGLIWIDAHMNAHTNSSTEDSEWWNCQTITSLLGEGLKDFKKISDKKLTIKPENLTLIAVRNFDTAEKALLKRHKVKVYYMSDVREEGFEAIFEKAVKRATDDTDGFGISIDLDSFDPKDAPAVSTPERDGLKAKNVLPVVQSIGHHPLFKALEFAEFNPHNDIENKTSLLIANIIKSIFTPYKKQNNKS